MYRGPCRRHLTRSAHVHLAAARAFDLPGWPCPPRVRDIPSHENSWGWVPISVHGERVAVAVDELGFLWANGDVTPAFKRPREADANPGAVVCWTSTGLGLWVHPKSLQYMPSVSRLDMKPDEWTPIAIALHELPAHIQAAT